MFIFLTVLLLSQLFQQSRLKLMTNYFKTICVILLLQISIAQDSTQPTDLTVPQIWGFGILTGVGVSLIGFLAAMLLVGLKKCFSEETFKTIINLLYSLGCGALIGDTMIHILPESFSNPDVNPRFVSLTFILSIFFFLILERLFEAYGVAHKHWEGEEEHNHDHAQIKQPSLNNGENFNPELGNEIPQRKSDQVINSNTVILNAEDIEQTKKAGNQNDSNKKEEKEEEEEKKSCLQNLKGKGSSGYLNLISSFIHNFMDGFGIGVAFASGSRSVFIPIVIAIFAHEIPRQMGDVAILMKNGFTGIQTILCNGFINVSSLIGVVIGLAVGNLNEEVNIYVLTFVAGNFIYIGADIWRHLFKNKTFFRNALEFGGVALGVGCMYLVLLAQQ